MIISILETFQNEDGSVTIPEVLRPYMMGMEAPLAFYLWHLIILDRRSMSRSITVDPKENVLSSHIDTTTVQQETCCWHPPVHSGS
ncbi:serS [Symbiodinium sp. CCMP2592]|nr:serS [Symbiodinium sp. CCMP2592]